MSRCKFNFSKLNRCAVVGDSYYSGWLDVGDDRVDVSGQK